MEYTVLTGEKNNEEVKTAVTEKEKSKEFVVKAVGNKIYVTSDGRTIDAINVRIDELSEEDQKRFKEGIAFKNESEVLALKEYLES